MKEIISVIPARSGSKGIINKNFLDIYGKSLFQRAIDFSLNSKIIQETYVSTNSKVYESKAKNWGAKSLGLRSEDLAADNTKTIDVIIDFFKKLGYYPKLLVLLQPTSPIRFDHELKNMLEILNNDKKATGITTIKLFEEPHPYKLKVINENDYLESFLKGMSSEVPRQKLPRLYRLTGSIYLNKVKDLLKSKKFIDNRTLSFKQKHFVNIDGDEDLEAYKNYLRING